MNLQTLKNRKSEKGFTIVELLIVIVVIAILAAISIVAYTGIQDRSRNSAAISLAGQLARKADSYYAINSSYPTTAANFNGTNESALEGIKVTVGSGAGPTAYPVATSFGTTAATNAPALSQFTNGTRVIYNATANGYVITYRTGSSSIATITKGTALPATPAYGFVSNENL